MISRRKFNQGLITLAFTGLSRHVLANQDSLQVRGYGDLVHDPKGILDLPVGFSYQVISSFGEMMSDGLTVPNRADGMGCFALDNERVVLVRNHELSPMEETEISVHPHPTTKEALAYDYDAQQRPLPGGTSHIIYNLKKQQTENQFMSLLGTIRNCSGGTTPWQTWLTCEESVVNASNGIGKDHGYVFEVPANITSMVKANPIVAMGRFNHEAACVDPRTGIVYLTEDRHNSLFYRFIPNQAEKLHEGGRLQALALKNQPKFDSRNWNAPQMLINKTYDCTWVDLNDVHSPNDDLRLRGFSQGAALFARGEGVHWGNNELFFCCTNGGAKKLGQVMRYIPSPAEGKENKHKSPGKLSLFIESPDIHSLNYGDNITVAPNGHLIVCEDQYTKRKNNNIKGITPTGHLYDIAKVQWQTEPAGACFSPDGSVLFVNLYSPTRTLAITGPWDNFVDNSQI